MSFFTSAFNAILYRPLLNGLILLYEFLPGHDFGVAIIVLTILIKFILYPLGAQGVKSQKILSELQPKIKEIQSKYKNNKEEQTKMLMALYKEKKVNPFAGCLPLLIQLPILFALYRVFWKGFKLEQTAGLLYSFVPNPGVINTFFLGVINLANPNFILALLAGIFQFFQVKMASPQVKSKSEKNQASNFSQAMQNQMQYFMPAFTVIILFRLPSAIGLYWVVVTLFTIIQQYFIFKKSALANINKEE
jgi:YidC/Oxa1 family membrane protein insertase